MVTLVSKNTESNDRIRRFQAISLSFIHSDSPPINRQVPATIRNRVTEAAGEKCPLCPNILISTTPKKTPLDDRESTPDHILDLCLGGNNTVENFLILCHECNFAKARTMTDQLKIVGIKLGSPGHSGWYKEFPRKSSNLTKLLEYIEWSFRIEDSTIENVFPELHGLFMKYRHGISREHDSSSEIPLQITTETPILAELEERIEVLENTIWKRFARYISGLFKRKPKPPSDEIINDDEKTPPPTRRKRSKSRITSSKTPLIDFTPEKFSRSLLNQKKKGGPGRYALLYRDLIKEEPSFNLRDYGFKPNHYLTEYCSDFLIIEERQDGKIPPTTHYWIDERIDEKPISEKPQFNLEKWIQENWEGESTYPELSKVMMAHEKQNNGNRKLKDILKEDFDIPTSWDIAKKSSHWTSQQLEHTNAGIEKFRSIIIEIIAESDKKTPDDRHNLTVSALGLRFSKRVQTLGFENKKDYFQQNGLNPTMSITKAISANFSEEEIEFAGDDNRTHVILNRRG